MEKSENNRKNRNNIFNEWIRLDAYEVEAGKQKLFFYLVEKNHKKTFEKLKHEIKII